MTINDKMTDAEIDAELARFEAEADRQVCEERELKRKANIIRLKPPDTRDSQQDRSRQVKNNIGTGKELRKMTFAPLKYIVPGLIVEGLVLLAGKPKVGKSWLALDVSIAVAAGRFCLGDRKCEHGSVLYLALEDGQRRLQRRIDKILPTFGEEWPDNWHYATDWPRADQKGVEQIEAWCEQHLDARLVVIDVLARFRAPAGSNSNAYQNDYFALAKLQELASRRQITILVVHHTRKAAGEDPVEEISGTLGLSGAADAFLVIKKSASGITLAGRGRDTEDRELAMQFNKDTCRWTILGAAAQIHLNDTRRAILGALVRVKVPLTPKVVAELTGLTYENVKKTLQRMIGDGQVTWADGKYSPVHVSPLSPETVTENTQTETSSYGDNLGDRDTGTAIPRSVPLSPTELSGDDDPDSWRSEP